MPEPVHIAAIDAGSNAVRLSVVRAFSPLDIEPLHTERYPLRLGEHVFVRNRFSEDVFQRAVKAFRHFCIGWSRMPDAVHSRSWRRQLGNQYPARPQGPADGAAPRGNGEVDDHPEPAWS